MLRERTDLTMEPGDYCDVYLTHDSMSVRKAHNSGRNHIRNVVDYYERKSAPPLFFGPDCLRDSVVADTSRFP